MPDPTAPATVPDPPPHTLRDTVHKLVHFLYAFMTDPAARADLLNLFAAGKAFAGHFAPGGAPVVTTTTTVEAPPEPLPSAPAPAADPNAPH